MFLYKNDSARCLIYKFEYTISTKMKKNNSILNILTLIIAILLVFGMAQSIYADDDDDHEREDDDDDYEHKSYYFDLDDDDDDDHEREDDYKEYDSENDYYIVEDTIENITLPMNSSQNIIESYLQNQSYNTTLIQSQENVVYKNNLADIQSNLSDLQNQLSQFDLNSTVASNKNTSTQTVTVQIDQSIIEKLLLWFSNLFK